MKNKYVLLSYNYLYVSGCKEENGKSYIKKNTVIRDFEKLTEEECRYATNPNTHVDFLIYNRITKAPVLAVEVDGFHYYKEGTQQAEWDQLKNGIFTKYEIPLLRLPTNGSGEIQKIKEQLLQD